MILKILNVLIGEKWDEKMEETKTFVINGFKIDITSITLTDGARDANANSLNEGQTIPLR